MKDEKISKAVRCLKALAHPIRLGILCSLKEGAKPVYQLSEELGTTQSNLSQHLANMREREILVTDKQANQVFYSVRDPKMFELLEVLQRIYCKDLDNET